MADLSFDERRRLVQAAIASAIGGDLYIAEMYEDRAVYEMYGDGADSGKSFEVSYTISDSGEVTLGDRAEVKREIVYTAVKFVDGTDGTIEGLAIPYGGPARGGKDIQGEDFGADTDYALDWFPNEGRPTLYHHGIHKSVQAAVVGRQTERDATAKGQFVRVELDKRNKYMAEIQQLVDDGALSFSSGAMPHLVQTRKDGHITRWPWVELSLTPTPANPFAGAYSVKSADAIEHLTAVKAAVALKSILESEGGSESEPFATEAERVQLVLDAFAQRAVSRVDARAKANRGISAANRSEIADVVESLRPLGETYQRLSDLLARTDPEAADAAKAAEVELLRFLREQARQNGVLVDA